MRKYKTWFEEIVVGLQKIRSSAGVSVITIPKKVMQKHHLEKDAEVLVVLLLRKRKLVGESEGEERWIRLDKKTAIQFERFKKEQDELVSVSESL